MQASKVLLWIRQGCSSFKSRVARLDLKFPASSGKAARVSINQHTAPKIQTKRLKSVGFQSVTIFPHRFHTPSSLSIRSRSALLSDSASHVQSILKMLFGMMGNTLASSGAAGWMYLIINGYGLGDSYAYYRDRGCGDAK